MTLLIRLIRSMMFTLVFWAWLGVMGVVCLPFLLFPRRIVLKLAKFWVCGLFAILKYTVGISHRIEGAENIPCGAAIIAAKHQSAWETFALLSILPDAAIVLKRQLLWLPLYGWYAAKMDHIAVDRTGKTAALRKLVEKAQQHFAQGRQLIIFPQGTRVPPGHYVRYKPGIAALYQALDIPVVPLALNSGLVWQKRQFLKNSGIITLSFLPAIEKGLDKKEFMQKLETRIEQESNRLLAEVSYAQ